MGVMDLEQVEFIPILRLEDLGGISGSTSLRSPEPVPVSALPGNDPGRWWIYTASRASLPSRPAMWRAFRAQGVPIISSWIDEDGEGQTECFGELWERIWREIAAAERLVLYAETDDFPLKGAIVEVGIALGMGKPVTVCLPGVQLCGRTHRPIGSWIKHPLVSRNDDIRAALTGEPASDIDHCGWVETFDDGLDEISDGKEA